MKTAPRYSQRLRSSAERVGNATGPSPDCKYARKYEGKMPDFSGPKLLALYANDLCRYPSNPEFARAKHILAKRKKDGVHDAKM
jgi:hypothetical protein